MGNCNIRPYRAGDFDQYAALFQEVFGKEMPRSVFAWKHCLVPGAASSPLIYVAEHGNAIVGARSLMPFSFVVAGEEVKAAQACDSMVGASYRGRGIYSNLNRLALEDAQSRGFNFIYNFPNRLSYPPLTRLGWQSLGELHWLVKVFDFRPALQNILPPRASFLLRPANAALRPLRRLPSLPALLQVAVEEFDTAHSRLWIRPPAAEVMARRDLPYLIWRYRRHPLYRYRLLSLRRGPELLGCAVLREPVTPGRWEISDWVVRRDEPRLADYLLRGVLHYVRNQGGWLLRMWSPVSRQGYPLSFGLLRRPAGVYIVAYPLQGGMKQVQDRAAWHLVPGDSDTR